MEHAVTPVAAQWRAGAAGERRPNRVWISSLVELCVQESDLRLVELVQESDFPGYW